MSPIESYLISSVRDIARIVTKSKSRDDDQRKKYTDMVRTLMEEYDYNEDGELKFINPQLADYFWSPENITNRSYKYMFAFSNLEKVSIPQLKVNQTIGFKANYVTQGFMGLNKIRSRDIVNLLNTYSN